MQTYLDIFRLKFEAKLSDRQISQALNIGRATISDLVIRFNNLARILHEDINKNG